MLQPAPLRKRDLIPSGIAVACLCLSVLFPGHATTIWLAGIATALPLLFAELRRPVNYHALSFDTQGYSFQLSADMLEKVKWSEVRDVYYVREFNDFANQIETEWEFRRHDGRRSTVLVEWPDRSRFARAIVRHLPQVSTEKVHEATQRRDEGRWSVVVDAT